MKRLFLTAFASIACAISAMAVPACPAPATVAQPDGSSLTIFLRGDEFSSFSTTADGYTVVRDASGAYVYARADASGALVPSAVVAHDPSARSAAENAFLASARKYLTPRPGPTAEAMRRAAASGSLSFPRGLYDYKKFHGLVILVNFNNRKFLYSNASEIFTDMVTKKNYDGFTPPGSSQKVEYTGSVRDYFYDNSSQLFDPVFDVVGPVEIDLADTYPHGTDNMASVVSAVINAADPLVDFSRYDTDGDGMVDMFYIIFAGGGSNFSGNDENFVWPHAWNVSYFGIRADGVNLGRYACSTELYGSPAMKTIDGIGTVCHEFSHVLGLMDEYDTDYGGSGGQSRDPGEWSVMAGGSYLNFSRTPVGYSLFERYQSGFAVPEKIEHTGTYTLRDIDASNHGFRIDIPDEPREYFLLENRRQEGNKWNAYGPGHGMLVFRVDSTNTSVWSQNDINVNPAHNYYELLRARPDAGTSESQYDPFPGLGNVTALAPHTSPAFLSWAKLSPKASLTAIRELENGDITFTATVEELKQQIEDFEEMTTTSDNDKDVRGKFCNWTFTNASVVEVPAYAEGKRAVAMVKGSAVVTSAVEGVARKVGFMIRNSSSRTAMACAYYSTDGGNTWNTLTDADGIATFSIPAGTTARRNYNAPSSAGLENACFRVRQMAGSSAEPLYLDDFIVTIIDPNEVASPLAPRSGSLSVALSGASVTVEGAAAPVRLFDFSGRLLLTAPVAEGRALITLPARGCYILTDGLRTAKVIY